MAIPGFFLSSEKIQVHLGREDGCQVQHDVEEEEAHDREGVVVDGKGRGGDVDQVHIGSAELWRGDVERGGDAHQERATLEQDDVCHRLRAKVIKNDNDDHFEMLIYLLFR